MDWRGTFIGREADMEILRTAFDEARGGSTRIVALVAESGFGKTRLAQEFYGWLSTVHDGVDGEGYWPDKLLRRENNLQVNPTLEECGGDGKRMPFLWWGLRIGDPGKHNQTQGDALRQGVDVLKAHLEAYAREIHLQAARERSALSTTKGMADVAMSVGETVIEKLSDTATFGLLGIGKRVHDEVRTQRGILRDIERLEDMDVSPAATEHRRKDLLTETILADLHRIAKAPPANFAPVPLVIVVDDIQWLSTDPGMAGFLPALVQRARDDGWPLLLLLTSWRAEWRRSATAGEAPGALLSEEDVVHELGRAEGLEAAIDASFPGLAEDQRDALARKADGNPRLLDEMLKFLEANAGLFADRNPRGPLTEQGLTETVEKDLPDFIAERLREAPIHVRRALAIASIQGVAFSPRLVRRVAEGLRVVDAEQGLMEGDDPHSFVTLAQEGEFRLAPYCDAARKELRNHLDVAEAEAALAKGLSEAASEIDQADDQELLLAFDRAEQQAEADEGRRAEAIHLAAGLIQRMQDRFATRAAGALAARAMPLLHTAAADTPLAAAQWILDADQAWTGINRDHQDVLSGIVEALRAQPTPGARRELAIALARLGDVVEALDGPAAARPLREEETAIHRALAEAQPSPGTRRELAIALGRLGDVVKALDSPATARPLHEEATAIFRALAEAQPTPGARRELAIALGRLGNVVEALDGPAAARPLHEEETAISRALAEAQPTPGARRDLAFALARLGDVVEALDGPEAALPLREEVTAIFRALAEAQPTPQAVLDLVGGIDKLAGCVFLLEGPAQAASLRQEASELAAMADVALRTASSRLWLLGVEYRRLTDGLVGDAPWMRAFALEAAAGADQELAEGLETLSEAFRDWETRYGQVGSGSPESAKCELARCQLGLGDPVAAAGLGAATLAALHEIASLQPQRLGPAAVDAAIVLGLAQMRLRQSAEAMQTFEQAERDYASILRSSALGLRGSAAIARFKAELLAELGRKDDAMAVLKEGHDAAEAFARLGMMDGAAILKAFETRLSDR